jgi:hypothetical protein
MLCSVMMSKLVCHGADDWEASKRIDLAAKGRKVHSIKYGRQLKLGRNTLRLMLKGIQ